MNEKELISNIKFLNINLTSDMIDKFKLLCNELIKYNEITNLTSIKTEESIYLKHFYDSLTIVKVIDLSKIETLIDLGTGAGFPGLVLKIVFPHIHITLLDSNNKKIKWLIYISKKLNLDVHIINDRIENYSKSHLNEYDLVISRAVANLRVLTELSIPLVKINGYFIPFKGNIIDELEEAKETIKISNCSLIKEEKFYLLNQEGIRNLLLIRKNKPTTIKYLRTYDKIIKYPLKKMDK